MMATRYLVLLISNPLILHVSNLAKVCQGKSQGKNRKKRACFFSMFSV